MAPNWSQEQKDALMKYVFESLPRGRYERNSNSFQTLAESIDWNRVRITNRITLIIVCIAMN